MKTELKKRLLSFAWRLGGMIATALLAFVLENLNILDISPEVITVVGLIVGEITKAINSFVQGKIV